MENTKPHAALVASPGLGHLIPILELGHRLVTQHGFKATIIVVATDAATAQSQLQQQSIINLDLLGIVFLPPVDISSMVTTPIAILSQLALIMRQSLPLIRSAISKMKELPCVLIVDIFGTEAFAMASKFKMLKYVFWTSNAWVLAQTLYAPYISKEDLHDHVRLQKPMKIPGAESVPFEDEIDVFSDRFDDRILRDDYTRIGLEMAKADGILANTWEYLEPKTLPALRDPKVLGQFTKAPIHMVGPLVRRALPIGPCKPNNEILEWLDKQPAESVIHVSFGSGGTLSADQLEELAWGLELSQQRFVWVVRPPLEKDECGSIFALEKSPDGTPSYLPKGFVSRTHERGLVVPTWAPQSEILAHPSIGGFLSHCGWNSTLESITNGVPMIAWPLYAEQKMNAAMLGSHLGMAARVRSNGVVERKEIENMVRKVMEKEDGSQGMVMRTIVEDLRHSAEMALSKGSSSYDALAQVAKECMKKVGFART